MLKRFCDVCGVEIFGPTALSGRMTAEIKRASAALKIEIITAKDSTWNDGDFCKYCIIDAVNQLDDRPKAVCCGS